MTKMTLSNYQGALLGLAVGDALGATTENMWTKDIKRKYGTLMDIIGGGWLRLDAGQVTDDTDMTLAVANGLLNDSKDRSVVDKIGDEFLKWFHSDPVDVGAITRVAITTYIRDRGRKSGTWFAAGRSAHRTMYYKSAGNGTLMRCLPVALAHHCDADYMDQITKDQSLMTHYDPKATEACVIYNRIARRIINGEELKSAIRAEIKDTRYGFVTKSNPIGRPSGYVVDTFEWVLRALLRTDNYADVVIKLANLGSDSDTTAAIAGGLAGLYYGVDAIPERLASKIIRKDEILETAERLHILSGRE